MLQIRVETKVSYGYKNKLKEQNQECTHTTGRQKDKTLLL